CLRAGSCAGRLRGGGGGRVVLVPTACGGDSASAERWYELQDVTAIPVAGGGHRRRLPFIEPCATARNANGDEPGATSAPRVRRSGPSLPSVAPLRRAINRRARARREPAVPGAARGAASACP